MALSDGLAGYWSTWLGSSGYRLLDRTAYANHGTLTNMDAGTDWVGATVLGRSGRALDFDGTDDRVSSGSFTGQSIRFANIWIRPSATVNSSSTFQALFQLRFGTSNSWYIALGSATGLLTGEYITIVDTSTAGSNLRIGVTDGGSLAANEWSMVSFAWTGTTYQIYVNGLSKTTSTNGTPQLPTANQLILGCTDGDGGGPRGFFSGRIAECFYSNRIFSQSEIANLYRLGPGWHRPYQKRGYGYAIAGFKAYWHRRQSQLIGGGVR